MAERIASLDHLRGLGVLGILPVNAIAFAQPMAVYDHPALIPLSNADRLVWMLTEIFCRDKFITAFTLLFGVSTFLVGREPTVLRRRLAWLAVFGLIHGALVWHGDILLLYACTGFAFWRWRKADWRPLLAVGLLTFVIGALVVDWPHGDGPPLDLAQIARMKSGFLGSLGGNFTQWSGTIAVNLVAYVPVTMGGMMVGLALYRTGFLSGEASPRLYAGAMLAAALSLGAIAAAIAAATPWEPVINGLLCLPVVMGYAGGLILAGRTRLGAVLLHPLACAGRMAFTNYLGQSLVMTAIFYGGRGPSLFGTMGYAALLPIVAAVWAAQLIVSTLWLKRFRYGPFEWLWRSLTCGKLLPMGIWNQSPKA